MPIFLLTECLNTSKERAPSLNSICSEYMVDHMMCVSVVSYVVECMRIHLGFFDEILAHTEMSSAGGVMEGRCAILKKVGRVGRVKRVGRVRRMKRVERARRGKEDKEGEEGEEGK